jgi:hypothetical protein
MTTECAACGREYGDHYLQACPDGSGLVFVPTITLNGNGDGDEAELRRLRADLDIAILNRDGFRDELDRVGVPSRIGAFPETLVTV